MWATFFWRAPAPDKPQPIVNAATLRGQEPWMVSEHYTDEIIAGIYRDVAADLARGKQLRAFPLKNSDEPACTFGVFLAPHNEEEGAD